MSDVILIVDDEPDLVTALGFSLRQEGFQTQSAGTGAEALERVLGPEKPQLVLLDWMLPDIPGTEVFRRLRALPETAGIPVIMLTARGEEIDRVVGLELGADDYVVKPFSTRELVLRIRGALRRNREVPSVDPAPASPERLQFGPLDVDFAAFRAWVDGVEVSLTAREFRILAALIRCQGRVLTRDQVLASTCDGVAITDRSVDTHIKRIRGKLGAASRYVQTVRGVGYRFAANVHVQAR